jgi:ketosteroid isomerase-like protein
MTNMVPVNTVHGALLLLLLSLLLLSGCRVGNNPRVDLMDVDSAAAVDIRSTMLAYQDALVRGEARRIAPFFTADARLSAPGSADVVGATEIQTFRRSLLDSAGTLTRFSSETGELHVDGPVAFELGTFEESYTAGNGEEQVVRGRYAIRWQRGPEARWRIARFMLNHLPAAPADTVAP